jgi:hypothetical protein
MYLLFKTAAKLRKKERKTKGKHKKIGLIVHLSIVHLSISHQKGAKGSDPFAPLEQGMLVNVHLVSDVRQYMDKDGVVRYSNEVRITNIAAMTGPARKPE